MKNIIKLIALMFVTTNVYSQIGNTKSDIIQDHKNYTMEVTNDGTNYISYDVEFDNYTQSVACYLNKKQVCFQVLMLEPSSETNNWIKWFNDKNFVKLDGLIWKDYENSIVYKVKVEKGNCIVLKYFDRKL